MRIQNNIGSNIYLMPGRYSSSQIYSGPDCKSPDQNSPSSNIKTIQLRCKEKGVSWIIRTIRLRVSYLW
ncbi:unnamed protein product [Brassica oleracea]